MKPVEVPDFPSFYRAVHGWDPFPWQARLARQVEEQGWPDEIGVPTGLGKTACIDIAVWSLARQANLEPAKRTAPTRLWYVVNRRLLVDAAYSHGLELARLLRYGTPADCESDDGGVLRQVGNALASITGGGGADPLHICRMRGGAELGVRPPDPSQPAVIFATVPMYASRWLFRGYGCSASMRPVDAALAGTDSLVLLDEAHLSRPVVGLAEPLALCDVGDPTAVLPAQRSRSVLVSLTATGVAAAAFDLDEDDFAHPVVRRRLDASKPVRLVETTQARLVDALCREVVEAMKARTPSSGIVFVNTPSIGRKVFENLMAVYAKKQADPADVVLLTGRVRDREGDAIRSWLLDPTSGAPAGRPDRNGRQRHLIAVATQTLEVGADLDFDVLVTEACGARSLVQRLGRLNRLGDADSCTGAIVIAADVKDFGIYGGEPLDLWPRLRAAAGPDGCVDLGPRVVSEVVGPADDCPPRVGELLPAHVWEWAKTTNPPEGEAPPELFFSGFEDEYARASVVWRRHLPDDNGEVLPPLNATEAVEIPLGELRSALKDLMDGGVHRLRPDRKTIERDVPVERLMPGDQVLIPAEVGGYDAHGWAPTCRETVTDPSLLRPPGIPLTSSCISAVVASGEDLERAVEIAKLLANPPGPEDDVDRGVLATELRNRVIAAGPNERLMAGEWQALVEGIEPKVEYPVSGVPRLVVRRIAAKRGTVELRSDAFDQLSFTATSADLGSHLGTVGELALAIAVGVGLPSDLAQVVALAGRFHDLGKHDVRFQRWLDPNQVSPNLLAKSSRSWQFWERDRRAAGWPLGGRHEELSGRLVAEWLNGRDVTWDIDLVLHLVVSHHGNGRPLVPPASDEAPTMVVAEIEGTTVSASGDLADVDWDQPARFRRCCERYGYWGLALMEAILRQADHQASSAVVA